MVKKNGLLELIETEIELNHVGGLDILKDWLLKRKEAFGQRAVQYGLPTPKGLLIVGPDAWRDQNRLQHTPSFADRALQPIRFTNDPCHYNSRRCLHCPRDR